MWKNCVLEICWTSLLPELNLKSSNRKYFLLHHVHTYPKYLEKSWRVPASSERLIRNGILLSTNQCSHEMGWIVLETNLYLIRLSYILLTVYASKRICHKYLFIVCYKLINSIFWYCFVWVFLSTWALKL